MPSSGGVGTRAIVDAVASGELTEAQVDVAVARVLAMVERAAGANRWGASTSTPTTSSPGRPPPPVRCCSRTNRTSCRSIPAQGGPVAVIGEFARTPRYQGAGSSQVNPTRLENALDSLRSELAGKREVLFAPGFEIEAEQPDPAAVRRGCAGRARTAEVALVFLGLPPSYESEGWDREHMDLPALQLDLLAQVAAVNPNVVVVLSNGSAVVTSGWDQHVARAARGLAARAGGRSCDRRPVARARLAVGQAGRDDPAEVHRQPHGRELPGRETTSSGTARDC